MVASHRHQVPGLASDRWTTSHHESHQPPELHRQVHWIGDTVREAGSASCFHHGAEVYFLGLKTVIRQPTVRTFLQFRSYQWANFGAYSLLNIWWVLFVCENYLLGAKNSIVLLFCCVLLPICCLSSFCGVSLPSVSALWTSVCAWFMLEPVLVKPWKRFCQTL